MNRYYVYILISLSDHKLYIGFTSNLKRRICEHDCGQVTSTKYRRPLRLIHYEYYIDKKDAKSREVFLKSGFGRKELKKALQSTLKEHKYKHL